MITCSECGTVVPLGTRGSPRQTCGQTCRTARHKRLKREGEARFRADAIDLVTRQTAAAIAGDAAALAQVVREAERLFA